MPLPYNRALHPEDYDQLQPHLTDVQKGEAALREKAAPYRKDHTHREWEYANVLRQLRDLTYAGAIPGASRILDTGFGANYFTPTLKTLGYNVEAMDSMHYGDCTPWLIQQCYALDIEVPLHVIPAGLAAMEDLADETYDVTLCISTIEHVDARDFEGAWSELARVTKIGGYVMATTDYFRDLDAWHASKYKQIQHTPVTEQFLDTFIPKADVKFGLKTVGGTDFTYRGDFVDNYSFVNLCFQRVR
jgi:2-polyprenyl-3-methyl-5-hydroxy-6-metoxy-1,4-benzoquinol methylase